MKDIKEKIERIIEMHNSKPACKHCNHCCDGCCVFGCVNERNGGAYHFSNKRLTTPEYSCSNFESKYNFNENTIDALSDLLEDINRANSGIKNFNMLIDGKITESEFIDIMK